MKHILLVSLFFLLACTSTDLQDNNMQEGTDDRQDMENHIGCQEGEIDVDGNCLPAEENTAQLFNRSLNVTSQEMQSPSGYLAQPQEPGNYPGVIMIHEWWGLNDNIKYMAELLASEGYVVYAVDLYDGEVAENSSRAGELAGSVRNNPEEAIAKMQSATEYLREQGAQTVGSIGWCFGGQQSLQASLNEDIDATVIYYGNLIDDSEQLQNLNGPVLGIFGEEDSSIPVSSVESFEESLNQIGTSNEIHIYPGVGHAFANPSGSRYAAQETQDAWEKTIQFLNENLN